MRSVVENVVILDSSKTLSESETRSLFSNCGEILGVYPFSLPPNSLREFPGLSQYFIQLADPDSANQACQVYVPAELKVDLLTTVPELSEVFIKTSQESQKNPTGRKKRTRRGRRPSQKQSDIHDRIAVLRCESEIRLVHTFQIHELFSSCGNIVEIHAYSPDNLQARYFFIEFAKKEHVACAERNATLISACKVFSLAENKRFVKKYRKCAKSGQRPVSKEGPGESGLEQGHCRALLSYAFL